MSFFPGAIFAEGFPSNGEHEFQAGPKGRALGPGPSPGCVISDFANFGWFSYRGMMILVLPATNRGENQSFRIYSASPTTFLEWICPQLAYVSRSTSRHGRDFGRYSQSGAPQKSDFGKCSNRQTDTTVRQDLAWKAHICL